MRREQCAINMPFLLLKLGGVQQHYDGSLGTLIMRYRQRRYVIMAIVSSGFGWATHLAQCWMEERVRRGSVKRDDNEITYVFYTCSKIAF